ncbi:MAG: hypothetical protein ACOY0S_00430 [Patescibacteria group bacterium]
MATLTETAYYTRRTINWIILAFIAYIVLRIFWSIFVALWLIIFPPKPPPPNHAFGKLPALKFPPPEASPAAQLTFRLETIQGSVPTASASATVYFMPKSPANLLAITRAQNLAKRLGFDPTPIQESKNLYRFNDPTLPLRRLRYDLVSNNFVLRYAFEQDPGFFTERNLPSQDEAIAEARSLLQTYNLYAEDIAGGKISLSFLKFNGNRLVTTTSLSQADSLRVDFFRKPIGGTPIFYPHPNEAPISLVFSGSRNANKRLIQFAYTYWPIDYQTLATYSLKTSYQAWQELQSGGGYIARYPLSGNNVAVIRNVYLAYYDSFEPQTYLQPIFVFEGDEGFLAYIPAVASEWTE